MSIDTRDLPTDIYLNMKSENFENPAMAKKKNFKQTAPFYQGSQKVSGDLSNYFPSFAYSMKSN